tara:strand:+ start:607 stop:1326 length:720 start_codon:yes stop_codon:yes gene_type:complete
MENKTTLSFSSLKEFIKSPAHFIAYKKREYVESASMRLGTAVHMALLEPQRFINEYDVTDLRKNTKAYKEMAEENPEITYMNNSDWATIQGIKRRFAQNLSAVDLLAHCKQREKEVKGEIHEVPFRGFVDAMSSSCIVDIKTTQDGSPEGFSRSVYNYGYHLQAAVYRELTGVDDYYIIAIENSSPYNVCIYKLSEGYLDKGFQMMTMGIAMFKEWDGEETGYQDEDRLQVLELPNWAK